MFLKSFSLFLLFSNVVPVLLNKERKKERERKELFMMTFKDLEVEQKVKRSEHFIFLSINPGGIFSPNRAFPIVAKFEAGITILCSLIFGLCYFNFGPLLGSHSQKTS